MCTKGGSRTHTSLGHLFLRQMRLPLRHFGILHTRTDSNRRQKFWRFLCYHYTTGMCVVIPEGFEPPHLLVRSEMFYPIKLRNHFMWTISTEFFCCTSMFCTHVLFATEFFCLGFYNLFSSMDKNLILHPNTGDTIHSKRLCGNPYHILQNQVLLCFCVLTCSISFT